MLSTLLALALVVCAPAQTPSRAAELVAALGNASDAVARARAFSTLVREKPQAAIPLLAEAMPNFDLQGQEYGFSVLSMFPIEATRGALQKLVLERPPLLEVGAAVMLFRQGAREQLEHIVRPFGRKDLPSDLRRAMVRRVFLVNEAPLSIALRAWLVPEADPLVVEEVLYHLLTAEDPGARAKAVELAAAPGVAPGSRAACAAFLLALGEDAQGLAVAELISADDGASLARLQRFLIRAPRLPPELVAAVAHVAETARSQASAQYAINVLALHAGPKELPVLERLMGSPDLSLAKSALDALQKRGVRIPRETLMRMLDSKEGQRALAAADALRRLDDPAGFERVLALAKAPGADRNEALRVLAKFRRQASVAPLVDALEDAELTVRQAAESGLILLLPSLFPYRRFELSTSGYLASGTPEQRAAGMRAIRAWCAANVRP